ncbi:WD40 repeat domain-containing protein [Streptomyces mirabilis]|uniref:NACHT and WD repeat domain-containing protein n=1 Tax=Streptomyces mirabilis TaxID=68239 RepID=UPI003318D49A
MREMVERAHPEYANRPRPYVVLSLGIPLTHDDQGDSPRPGLNPLEKASEHAEKVRDALLAFQYTEHPAGKSDPQRDCGDLVQQALTSTEVGVLIVHIVGHGELAEGSSEKLYILDSRGKRLSQPVSAWIEQIEDFPEEYRPMTLFVLDVCHAGEVAVTSWHAQMDIVKRRAWVLAATGSGDKAFGYRLSKALVSVLEKYRHREVRFDPSVRHISSSTVWRDIELTVNSLVDEDKGLPQTIRTSLVPGHADLSHLPFFPNPAFGASDTADSGLSTVLPAEMARLADWAVDPEHFLRRAGGAEPVDRPWGDGYFCGREKELRELSTWLNYPKSAPGLRVVTGLPGSGKSALLGILACAAHPVLRRHTQALWGRLDEKAPGESDEVVVIHARRLSLDEIRDSIKHQLNLQAVTPIPKLRTTPTDRLLHEGQSATVIIDALDEAVHPEDVTKELLLPLAIEARNTGNRLRLLVGTRDDSPCHDLLALAHGQGALTDLNAAPPATVCDDLFVYVRRLLTARGPYALGTRQAACEALARAIAEQLTGQGRQGRSPENADSLQWGEFLTAGLYVHYLLAAEHPRNTPQAAAELGRAVPRSLPELLELDLRRHTGRPLLRPVLTALAFAQGRGMPEEVLAHAATAFTEDERCDPLPLQELYTLLDHEARFYLRRDVDDDSTLYHLFHEGLADWLRRNAQPPASQQAPVLGSKPTLPEELLYERMLGAVPADRGGHRRWYLAAPYLLRHIAQHALAAGRLDELLQDGGFLLHATPDTLGDTLIGAASEAARFNAAVYQASRAIHRTLQPEGRRQVLAIDATRSGNTSLQAELPNDLDWQVRWVTGGRASQERAGSRPGHKRWVEAVAVAELEDGQHAVTAGFDGTVRLWDLTAGTHAHQLVGPTGRVLAMAVVQLKSRPHVVTVDSSGGVGVWDLTTRQPARRLTGHKGGANAVAVAELEGRPHAVTAGFDRSVRVWDLTTGRLTHQLAGHTKPVNAVAVAQLEGRPHAVTGGFDRSVRVWDLTTGRQTHQFIGHTGWVRSVAVADLAGRPHAVTAGCSVRVWDLTTGQQTRRFGHHSHTVRALAVARLKRRPHVVTAGDDRSVRVWDLTTGSCLTSHYLRAEASPSVAVTADGTVLLGVDHEVVALSLTPLMRRLL